MPINNPAASDAAALIAIHAAINDAHHTPPTPRVIDTGSYVGDGAANRQITTGFKCSKVMVMSNAQRGIVAVVFAGGNKTLNMTDIANQRQTPGICVELHATDGFLVNVDPDYGYNVNSETFRYWAISE
ncbi:hypothetical protein ES703_71955 [subsurface metagenome]